MRRTEMRRFALVAGTALVILAFAAATRVADTREGLIAEVVTLLTGVTTYDQGPAAWGGRRGAGGDSRGRARDHRRTAAGRVRARPPAANDRGVRLPVRAVPAR